MEYANLFEYKCFGFYDTDPNMMLCHDLAYDELEKMYPNYLLLSSDCLGIDVIDDTSNSECGKNVASFSMGRLGKGGPLAMRNEGTKEVFPLVNKYIDIVEK